jgi:ubiquinone/menaquinone biosynthesis C-methylase UbiE
LILSVFHKVFWDMYGGYAWDEVQFPFRRTMIKAITGILKEKQDALGEKVLDAGCGTGNYALALAEEGFQVTGIDYSTGMLQCAQSKVTRILAERLIFEKQDLNSRLSYPDAYFDHVISITSLWTVADPRVTLSELTRVLKQDGTLIVTQVPKSTDSLGKTVSYRIKRLGRKTPLVIALVAIKAILEKTNATKYWTPEELLALLLSNKQLNIEFIDHGPPIIIVARKR